MDEQRYPSVTSILAKTLPESPELQLWKRIHGEEEAKRIMQERAVIGSCVHFIILSKYSIRTLEAPVIALPWKRDVAEWLQEIGYRTELSLAMWEEAIAKIKFEPLFVEHSLISRKYRFAGTFDLLAKIYDKNILFELKTSKELWNSHKIQLALYDILCRENDIRVDLGVLVSLHPFPEEGNPSLKPKTVWLNRKELDMYGKKGLELVKEFWEKHHQDLLRREHDNLPANQEDTG